MKLAIQQWLKRLVVIFLSLPINATDSAAEMQRLACFFYDQKAPQDGMGLFNAGLPSIWAKGLADEDIYVSGSLRDGFFKVYALKGQTRGFFGLRLVAKYENSESLARHFCQRGLKYAFPESHENKELVHFGVRASFLSTKYSPTVFKHYNNKLLDKIDKIVVFGDSLSDQGNLKRWLRIFPNAPYFAGRFSNHFIWIDYLQKMTGISVQNLAIGGSVSNIFLDLEFNQKPFNERTKKQAKKIIAGDISEEINKYKNKSLVHGHITEPMSTLYSIWIGGNDYISTMESPTDVDTFLDYPDDQRVGSKIVISRVTNHIIRNIKKLYTMGARNFLVANMPDLGQLPRILENQSYHAKIYEAKQNKLFILSQKMTSVSDDHNRQLRHKIDLLKNDFLDINIVFIDVSGSINTISKSIDIKDGTSNFNYDFNKDLATRITIANQTITINRPCYTGNEVQTNNALICKEPHKALFWDKTHPSSYTHCLLAAYIHQQAAHYNVLRAASVNQYLNLCRPELALTN
jgi:thermolabile hemolysin